MSRDEKHSLLASDGEVEPRTATPSYGLTFFSNLWTSFPYWHFDIHTVCKKGDYGTLKHFVERYQDKEKLKAMVNRVDVLGYSPLYRVLTSSAPHIKNTELACVQLLLNLGADPNFCCAGNLRCTSLTKALFHFSKCRIEMAALLVKYGAHLDQELCPGDDRPLIEVEPTLVANIRHLSQGELDFIAEFEKVDIDYLPENTPHKKN